MISWNKLPFPQAETFQLRTQNWKSRIILYGVDIRQVRTIKNILNQFKFVELTHGKLSTVPKKANLLLVEELQRYQWPQNWKIWEINLKTIMGLFHQGVLYQWQLLQYWKIKQRKGIYRQNKRNESASPSGSIVEMAASTELKNKKKCSQKDNGIVPLGGIVSMAAA